MIASRLTLSGTLCGSAHGDDEAMSTLNDDLQRNDFDLLQCPEKFFVVF